MKPHYTTLQQKKNLQQQNHHHKLLDFKFSRLAYHLIVKKKNC